MKIIQLEIFITFMMIFRLGSSQKPELPPGLQICYRNMPSDERNECLKQSISKVIPVIKKGFAPLNIASFDPLFVEKSDFDFNQGILRSTQNLKNIIVKGLSGVQIKGVKSKANDKNILLELDVLYPKLHVEAEFSGNSVLSELTVKSEGKIKMEADDVISIYKILGKLNKTNNDDLIQIKGFELLNLDTKLLQIEATGLFPDPDVNAFAVQFINQEWKYLFQQLVPSVKKIWGPVCMEVAKNFFEQIPYSQLMPKKED
uniref:CSON011979 protein n=1 Tax=Culicoides sonorensis TaxID=179676 RepID=A0A336KJZ6_CULSO